MKKTMMATAFAVAFFAAGQSARTWAQGQSQCEQAAYQAYYACLKNGLPCIPVPGNGCTSKGGPGSSQLCLERLQGQLNTCSQPPPPPPLCDATLDSCAFATMPLYDQTNPNFALLTVPFAIWQQERQPAAKPPLFPVGSYIPVGSCSVVNTYYTSWLPFGPIPGDPGAIGSGCNAWWWYTAICGPTSESMALMAAIGYKAATTTISGWTQGFVAATPPANQVGAVPNPFIPSTAAAGAATAPGTSNRSQMTPLDVQRVILMAISQGTLPNGGGGMSAFLSTVNDFTPPAVANPGSSSGISNAAFTTLIQNGYVIVFCIHDYTAHVTTNGSQTSVTFTFNGAGHILAVNGEQSGTLVIYDPIYATVEMLSMGSVSAGTFSKTGETLTVADPEQGLSSVAIWPDSANPISSDWDIKDKQVITFIDGFAALKVN